MRVVRDVINVPRRLQRVVLDIVSRYLHTRVRQRVAWYALTRTGTVSNVLFYFCLCWREMFFFFLYIFIWMLFTRSGRDSESLLKPLWWTFEGWSFFQTSYFPCKRYFERKRSRYERIDGLILHCVNDCRCWFV